MPEGPFCKKTLQELFQAETSEVISREDVLEYLRKSSTVKDIIVEESLPVVPETQEPEDAVLPNAPTTETFNTMDLEGMFNDNKQNVDNVVMDMSTDSDSEGSNDEIERSILYRGPTPPSTQEAITIIQEPGDKKRKGCECNHDDYFGPSYKDLTVKAFFKPNYMAEREHPVHYCTGLKDNGDKCGYDFTNSDFVITQKNRYMLAVKH